MTEAAEGVGTGVRSSILEHSHAGQSSGSPPDGTLAGCLVSYVYLGYVFLGKNRTCPNGGSHAVCLRLCPGVPRGPAVLRTPAGPGRGRRPTGPEARAEALHHHHRPAAGGPLRHL